MLLPFASFAAILNAGLVATARVAMGGELVWKVDPTSWWDIQRVNVLGVLNTIRAAVPGMVRTDMTRELIRRRELDEGSLTPIETGAELIVRLASGEAEALSGRMIHVTDDLDSMIAAADEIRERNWYQLRLVRGLLGTDPL